MVNKFTTQPTVKEVVTKINELADAVNQGGSGTATDVQINGTSITSNNVANILTNTAYNSSSNKIATMSDLPTVPTKLSSFTDDLGSSPTHTHSQYLSSHQTIKQDGVTGATVNRFGTCSTGASTATKDVTITTGTWSLESGARVTVKFSNANTADTPKLKVNSGTAKNIFHNGSQITTGANKSLLAGVCDFVYDGTQYHLVGNYLDTDTTYANGTGISIGTGNAINHSNSVTAGTAGTSSATSGSTLSVPYVTYDAQGHVTATGTHTHTVSGFATTDTKNTAGSTDTSSKICLIGATSQAANPQTYSHDTAFVDTNGRLNSAAPASSANDTTVATTKWVKDQGYTNNAGTITGITMNGSSKGTSGVVDLGTVITSHQDISGKANTADLANVAFSGAYGDLTGTPTIPTVGNGTITFTQGGVQKGTFTTNQSGNTTIALELGSGGGVSLTDVLNVIYPVGSIYVSTNSTCAIASYVGTWELVASNKALWTGDGTNGGTTIAECLPNIKGTFAPQDSNGNAFSPFPNADIQQYSALQKSAYSSKTKTSSQTSSTYTTYKIDFDASQYNSKYSDNATTVQPPAYVVNVWRRTA